MTIKLDELQKLDLTDVLARPVRRLAITHPGTFLQTEFLEANNLSANALANALHVPANRITAILKGQRGVSADTALRLARFFGTSPDFWLNLQKDYDLRVAMREVQDEIEASVMPLAA